MDDNGDRKLTKDELFYGLTDYGCQISKAQSNELFALFDKNNDGKVNFDEFLVGIRG